MSTLPALPSDDVLQQALLQAPARVQRLADFLEQEFECLKQRDMAAFEALQAPKTEELEQLSLLAQWCGQLQPAPSAWQALHEPLVQSRENHLRNIQLLQRQLQAVRGALQAMQGDAAPAVDLYDRSGQVSRRYAAWSHHLA
jgi:flagellar biosynthesis/type III secretory pathway chaperone